MRGYQEWAWKECARGGARGEGDGWLGPNEMKEWEGRNANGMGVWHGLGEFNAPRAGSSIRLAGGRGAIGRRCRHRGLLLLRLCAAPGKGAVRQLQVRVKLQAWGGQAGRQARYEHPASVRAADNGPPQAAAAAPQPSPRRPPTCCVASLSWAKG